MGTTYDHPMTSDDSAPPVDLGAANAAAPRTVFDPVRTPARILSDLAAAARGLGLDTGTPADWDVYDEGGAVTLLEERVRDLLGTQAAAFFPSGIMAQQAALRVHTDRAGTPRVAMPDLAHLLVHEEDGPRLLQGLHIEPLTRGPRTATRADLEAIPGRLGAVLVEVPLREPGCLLPTWDDLVDLANACRERGVALHIDGARIWESQFHFGHCLPEIAALSDTIYVSFYKGLGALAGAVLAGSSDVIAEARAWRRRMGGTVFHHTAEALSALVGLETRLPGIPARVRWAREFARLVTPPTDEGGSAPGIGGVTGDLSLTPALPQTNQFLVHARGVPADLDRATLALTVESGLAFCRPWRQADVPGWSWTELTVGTGVLTEPGGATFAVDPEEAAALLRRVAPGMGV